MTPPLLRVEALRVAYPARASGRPSTTLLRAVDRVTFSIQKGESLGLVGESGCGKSTLARALLRLVEIEDGRVWFEGEEITASSGAALKALRRRMQIVLQDPASSLNPRLTVGDAVAEPLVAHRLRPRGEERARALELFSAVGLEPNLFDRLPHELSGGQRQRIAIARALAIEPRFIALDEPLRGLDGPRQAQIANLLLDLREALGLTFLLISHDLQMVTRVVDRVAVMYLGQLVEIGPATRLAEAAAHPYSRALWSASLRGPAAQLLEGEVPSPFQPPSGCRFHPRCPQAGERCRVEEPLLAPIEGGHSASCFFPVLDAGAARPAG